MTVQFCSFASGSSGNCYMVKDDETTILIDAGISGKRIMTALEETGTPADSVAAILVTHEHIDHVMSLPVMTKRIPGLVIYANEATWSAIERPVPEERRRTFVTGQDFYVGDFTIRTFAISHDAAEPVGYSIYHRRDNEEGDDEVCQISICTDSGCVSEEIFEEISCADLLVLEANHEKEVLLMGPYPYTLKQRILSDHGHLSNVDSCACLCRMIEEKPKSRRVLLGHLSHENNSPDMVMIAARNSLEEAGYCIDEETRVTVALRNERSDIFEI